MHHRGAGGHVRLLVFVPPTAALHRRRTQLKGPLMARLHSSLMQLTRATATGRDGLLPPARQRARLVGAVSTGRSTVRASLLSDDTGAATAEYAIATMAAVGFASLLVVIMRSDEVRGILTGMIRTALTVGG